MARPRPPRRGSTEVMCAVADAEAGGGSESKSNEQGPRLPAPAVHHRGVGPRADSPCEGATRSYCDTTSRGVSLAPGPSLAAITRPCSACCSKGVHINRQWSGTSMLLKGRMLKCSELCLMQPWAGSVAISATRIAGTSGTGWKTTNPPHFHKRASLCCQWKSPTGIEVHGQSQWQGPFRSFHPEHWHARVGLQPRLWALLSWTSAE